MSKFNRTEREDAANSASLEKNSKSLLQHPSKSLDDHVGTSHLLKPEKVKQFQQKERNILEQFILPSATPDFASNYAYSNMLLYPDNDGDSAPRMLCSGEYRIQKDSALENNDVNLSPDEIWRKNSLLSTDFNLLSPPASAFKKKDSFSSSTKKQRGEINLALRLIFK